MNYIFLDIDGVLNNFGTIIAYGNPSRYFDPVSVRLIERLADQGSASIVVSSSWRTGDTERLRKELLQRTRSKALVGWIVDETPDISGARRGEEIQVWLDHHPVQRYVIVDDDSDMLPGQNFVQTSMEDGFRYRHYVEALRYLEPEHVDCMRPFTAQPEQEKS